MKSNNLKKSIFSVKLMSAVAALFLIGAVQTSTNKVFAAENKATAAPTLISAVSTNDSKSINVTGEGEVNVVPDIAYISLGVTTEKSTVSDAQNSNTTAMNKVIDGIKKAGIASDDIKTVNYSIYPKYNYDNKTGNSTIEGYTVTSTLNVTVKDIKIVGNVIDTAISNGANNSNGVSFGVSDYEKYYNMALVKAISNGKSKAQAIAGAIDVKISMPLSITENSSGVIPVYPVFNDSLVKATANGQGMSVEPGTFKVKANVSIVYQY